jgi:hypothetical protein
MKTYERQERMPHKPDENAKVQDSEDFSVEEETITTEVVETSNQKWIQVVEATDNINRMREILLHTLTVEVKLFNERPILITTLDHIKEEGTKETKVEDIPPRQGGAPNRFPQSQTPSQAQYVQEQEEEQHYQVDEVVQEEE